jgi:hypothetical protein
LPLVTNTDGVPKETKRVHVYGKQWALVGDGYEVTALASFTLCVCEGGVVRATVGVAVV